MALECLRALELRVLGSKNRLWGTEKKIRSSSVAHVMGNSPISTPRRDTALRRFVNTTHRPACDKISVSTSEPHTCKHV